MPAIGLAPGSTWRETLDATGTSLDGVGADAPGVAPVILACDPVPASAWSATGTANVYSAPWIFADIPAGDNRPALWRTGVLLTRKTTLGALAADGDFFVSFTTGDTAATLYVYATTAPTGQPDGTYEATTRSHGIHTGAGATVEGVRTRGNLHPDGSIVAGQGATIRRVLAEDGGKHNIYIGSGLVDRSVAWDLLGLADAGSSTLFVANMNDATGETVVFRDTLAYAGAQGGGVVNYYSHADSAPLGYDEVVHEGAYAVGGDTAFAADTEGVMHTRRSPSGRFSYARACRTHGALACGGGTAQVDGLLAYQNIPGNETVTGANPTATNFASVRGAGGDGILLFPASPQSGPLTLSRVVLYQEAAAGQRNLLARYDGGEMHVVAHGVVWWQHEGQHVVDFNVGSTWAGDYNVWHRRIYNALEITWHNVTHTTLAGFQEATGQEAHSVYTNAADQTPGNPLAYWLGVAEGLNDGPLDGDMRINPNCRVYGPSGTPYVGTFTDGTPITAACGLEAPPSAWPALPATADGAEAEYLVAA